MWQTLPFGIPRNWKVSLEDFKDMAILRRPSLGDRILNPTWPLNENLANSGPVKTIPIDVVRLRKGTAKPPSGFANGVGRVKYTASKRAYSATHFASPYSVRRTFCRNMALHLFFDYDSKRRYRD